MRTSGLWNLFTFWITIERRYERIARDEQKRERSVSMGVQAIVQSVTVSVLIALCLWGLAACIQALASPDLTFFLIVIGIIVLAAAAVGLFVSGLIGALIYVIYQLKLNKRAIGKAALIVWIVSVAMCAGLTILFITLF